MNTFVAVGLLVVLGMVVTLVVPFWNAWVEGRANGKGKMISRWVKYLVVDEIGGYVHDTACAIRIPPELAQFSAGTWTHTAASNVWFLRRTAAASAPVLKIPIATILQNSIAQKGTYLKSIEIWYEITTAAATAITAVIQKQSLPGDNSAYGAPSAQAFTYDAGHDTAGERVTTQKHKMTLTLTTPIWMDDDDDVYVELTVDFSGAGTGVFDYHGARANVTTRL
ncbi:MAG TPA: hypothetical protein VFD70_29555 [Anaerolineae bacterium]|nr:hypothetical protein [Anaerolineae bacterium]